MISVIVPCYNSEGSISRALDSVLNQTYNNYEIIVVNNGSTDNTVKIVEDYQQKYPGKIKLLEERRKGAPCARNKGLVVSEGDWIQFLDSDDELLPHKLDDQIKIAKRTDCDIVVGNCWIHKGDLPKPELHLAESRNVWIGLIRSRLGRTSGMLWRRASLVKVGGWDETKTSSQEYNLLFELLKQNAKAAFSKETLTRIHVQDNSVHKSTNKERITEVVDNHIQLRLRVKEYLKANDQLTSQLSKEIDTYIHGFLMTFKRFVPEYTAHKLKVLELDLPISYIIKRNIRVAGHQIKCCKKQVVDLLTKSVYRSTYVKVPFL